MNRPILCVQCRQRVTLVEGVVHGKRGWLEYEPDLSKQHRNVCPAVKREPEPRREQCDTSDGD